MRARMGRKRGLLEAVGIVAIAAAVTSLGLPEAANAQTLRGKILDSQTGEPVMLAYVGLLAQGRELVVANLATSEGDFVLEAPGPGSYFLYVSRTGYETLMDGVFELGEGGMFDMRVGLKPAPVELEPLLVETEAEASALEEVGFYDRATMGRGHFLIREEIERVAVEFLTDALDRIPSLDVLSARPVLGPDALQRPGVVVRTGARQCSPTLYVDGHVVAFGSRETIRPDDWVGIHDVDAIEVYTRPSEVPAQFDAIDNCGVLLIWTRMR